MADPTFSDHDFDEMMSLADALATVTCDDRESEDESDAQNRLSEVEDLCELLMRLDNFVRKTGKLPTKWANAITR